MTYPSPFCGHFPSSGLARNRITAYHAPRFRQAAKRGVAVLYGTSHRLEVFRQPREEPRSAARGARRSHEGGERGSPLISSRLRNRANAHRRDLRHAPPARPAPDSGRVPRAPRRRRPHPARGRHLDRRGAARDRGDRPAGEGGARQHRLARAARRTARGDRGPHSGRRAHRDGPRRRAVDAPRRADANALPGGACGGLRPLAHPAPRGARRLPDLQPRQPDRPPPPAPPHDGHRARRARARQLRTRGARLMDLDVVFLGTAGSAPTAGRGLPATLIRRGGERLLIDCGEGTQRQLLRSIGLVDLEEIFLPHFHADHLLGLPGMLKTFGLRGRDAPLTIYGPPGLRALPAVLTPLIGRTPFELRIVELEPNEELDRDGYRIAAFNVRHRVQAYGYALIEDERPGRFDEQAAIRLGVRPGPDFGRLQQGETVTT